MTVVFHDRVIIVARNRRRDSTRSSVEYATWCRWSLRWLARSKLRQIYRSLSPGRNREIDQFHDWDFDELRDGRRHWWFADRV